MRSNDEEQSADTEQGEAASGDVLPRPDRIDADDRTFLVDQLGWFGELALAPAGTSDQAAREQVLEPAHRIFAVLLGAMIGLCTLGFFGFVGLILRGPDC